MNQDVLLEVGNEVTVTTDFSVIGTKDRFTVSYPEIVKDLKPGNIIFIR